MQNAINYLENNIIVNRAALLTAGALTFYLVYTIGSTLEADESAYLKNAIYLVGSSILTKKGIDILLKNKYTEKLTEAGYRNATCALFGVEVGAFAGGFVNSAKALNYICKAAFDH